MKEEKSPHTRKPLHWWRQGVAGGKLRGHGGECSTRGMEGKAERFPHRGSVLTTSFPGGAVVKNPPANAGDMGSSPGPGRSQTICRRATKPMSHNY